MTCHSAQHGNQLLLQIHITIGRASHSTSGSASGNYRNSARHSLQSDHRMITRTKEIGPKLNFTDFRS
jgi:hypothetical protein